MTNIINPEYQQLIADGIIHAAEMVKVTIQAAVTSYERPHVMYRPAIYIDGNQWCALYGEDIQSGVSGFGDSPAEAMHDFDKNWYTKLRSPGDSK